MQGNPSHVTAASASFTDDVIREIGEQVSLMLVGRLPRGFRGLNLLAGIARYENHMATFSNLRVIPRNLDGSFNKSTDKQLPGKFFEELDAHARRREGKEVYTTDQLASIRQNDPNHSLFQDSPRRLADFAEKNHPQTDLVELRPDGKLVTYQHKNYRDVGDGIRAMLKDADNDRFVVPSDQHDEYINQLTDQIAKAGPDAGKLRKIRAGLEKSPIKRGQAVDPGKAFRHTASAAVTDSGKRIAGNIAVGVAADFTVFAFGGAVSEIRGAYLSPREFTLMERCERLLRAIWDWLARELKDRSLREIGSEVVLGIVSAAARPLKLARAAVERIVSILRRLWMDLYSGKVRTVADVVSAALKAVYVVASAGVAILLEQTLSPYFGVLPGGDLLAAVVAAVVAGVMIVVGNRSIEHVVCSLVGIFRGAELAKLRREEIEAFCAAEIPRLISDRHRLEALVETQLADREALFACTFAELQVARDGNDIPGFLNGLQKLNQNYGKALPWRSDEELEEFMLDASQPLKL